MIYEAVCNKCGKYHEYVKHHSECYDTPECCGTKTEKRIFTASYAVNVDIPAYQSPATNKWITSRKERNEDLKRSGCRPWEGLETEKQEAAKVKQEADAQLDKEIDKTVRTAWANLPASQKVEALKASHAT